MVDFGELGFKRMLGKGEMLQQIITKIIDDKSDSMDYGWINDRWVVLEVEGFGCGEKNFTDDSIDQVM